MLREYFSISKLQAMYYFNIFNSGILALWFTTHDIATT